MLPELAAVYVIGLPATAALTGLHAFLYRRKMKSAEMSNIQSNLRTIGKYWSDSESKIKEFSEDSFAQDQRAYGKTVLWLGLFCFGFSWIGFFLQLLVMVSIRYIARPRLERAFFSSELAYKKLTS
jgi:hypothetical protein